MKLQKNILILLVSYLGALAVITCAGRFVSSSGGSTATVGGTDGSSSGDATEAFGKAEETEDIPVAGTSVGEEYAENVLGESFASGDPLEEPVAGQEEPTYYLRTVKNEGSAHAGVIGVYDEGGQLVRTLDTPVLALPESDRSLLEVGIEISGEDALAAIIEDYGG